MFMHIKSPCYTGHVLFANHFKREKLLYCALQDNYYINFVHVGVSDYQQWNIPTVMNVLIIQEIQIFPLGLIKMSATSLQDEKCAMTTGTRI